MTTPWPRTGRTVVAALALVSLGACACVHSPGGSASTTVARLDLSTTPAVRLRPGDVLAITVSDGTDVTSMVRIGADGRVNVANARPIPSAGRTLTDVARDLERVLGSRLTEVSLHSQLGERVAINGEVRRPGLLVVAQSMTVQDVIAIVGGTTAWADERNIDVIRTGTRGTEHHRLALASAAAFQVQAGDTIVVPTEPQGRINTTLIERP